MKHYYAMIMAGGGGTRLWPMSRQQTPKQLIPLVEDKSMFRISVDRLDPLFPPENIYVVTGEQYVADLQADAPNIPAGNFIVEPYGRNTAPAAALGMAVIQQRDPQAVVAILTADHHIANKTKFRDVLAAAYQIAGEQNFIVTLGISPSYPATGFGYIKRGPHLGNQNELNYYQSQGFKEKPDAATAIRYLSSGQYSWNSGMFIWSVKRAMTEFEQQQPEMFANLQKLGETVNTPAFNDTLQQIWEHMPRIQLDYAVMENAETMCVIPMDVGWSDVGSWGALHSILQKDESGNAYKGAAQKRHIRIDTQESLIFSDRLVVTVGLRDTVIIDTEDAILVCHLNRTQEVKDVVRELKNKQYNQYL